MSGIRGAQISFVGRVGQDPEMRYLPDGKAVTNISVAVNYRSRDKGPDGKNIEVVTWYRAAFFGAQAEAHAQYVHKGDEVFVTGFLQPRTYKANDGTEKISFDVNNANLEYIGGKRAAGVIEEDAGPVAGSELDPF